MSSIKNRNGLDLTEAEDVKRWQEYTEERHKKDLHDPDNHDGVITHLEPDILECKLTFSSPVATAEVSKFAGILSAALSQHHPSGFEIAQLEFHHLH